MEDSIITIAGDSGDYSIIPIGLHPVVDGQARVMGGSGWLSGRLIRRSYYKSVNYGRRSILYIKKGWFMEKTGYTGY